MEALDILYLNDMLRYLCRVWDLAMEVCIQYAQVSHVTPFIFPMLAGHCGLKIYDIYSVSGWIVTPPHDIWARRMRVYPRPVICC